MSDLAIIHICTIGIPFYTLQILQHIIYQGRKGQYIKKVYPQSNVQKNVHILFDKNNENNQINYKEQVHQKEEIQVIEKEQFQHIDKKKILSHESDSENNEMLKTANIPQSIEQQFEITNFSQISNRYFELMYNILLLVSCTALVYGVTLSIQQHHNLETQNAGEIIGIVIINQCFILILYNGIYKKLIEYLHNNLVKNSQFLKSSRQVSRFFLFSYNIFMLLVLMSPQIKYSTSEKITELVNFGLMILFQFILYFLLKKCNTQSNQN